MARAAEERRGVGGWWLVVGGYGGGGGGKETKQTVKARGSTRIPVDRLLGCLFDTNQWAVNASKARQFRSLDAG